MRTEEFIKFWNEKSTSSAESKLASRYTKATEELQMLRDQLIACLRPQKTSKGLVAAFSPEAERIFPAFEATEAELANVISDIEEFSALCNGPSLDSLIKEKNRLKKFFENANNAIRIATLRVVRRGKKSDTEAELDPEVQKELVKKDCIENEFGAKLITVEKKIEKARAILAKH